MRSKGGVPVSMRLASDVLAAVDVDAASHGENRTAAVERLLRCALAARAAELADSREVKTSASMSKVPGRSRPAGLASAQAPARPASAGSAVGLKIGARLREAPPRG